METKDKIFMFITILFTLAGGCFYIASVYNGEVSDLLSEAVLSFQISNIDYQFLSLQYLNLISQQNLKNSDLQLITQSFQFCTNVLLQNYQAYTAIVDFCNNIIKNNSIMEINYQSLENPTKIYISNLNNSINKYAKLPDNIEKLKD